MTNLVSKKVMIYIEEEKTNKEYALAVNQVRMGWIVYSYEDISNKDTYKINEEWTKKLENYSTIKVDKESILNRIRSLGLVENTRIADIYNVTENINAKTNEEIGMMGW